MIAQSIDHTTRHPVSSSAHHRRDSATGVRRFLFLFSDTGGGHRASSQAVRSEFRRLFGEAAAIEMVDLFVEMGRWPFDRFPAWYPTAVGLNGIPWGISYHLLDGVRLMKAMSRLVWPYAKRALFQVLRRYPADVIVSFHPLPNYILMLARRELGLRVPLAVVVQDLVTAHAAWFIPGAEGYCVPTSAARQRALRCGVPSPRVWLTGMPTRRCFAETMTLPQAEARERLRLPLDQPVLLIVGGGEGMGPLAQVVQAIAARRPDARLVVITGRNRDLYEELRAQDSPVPVQVEGFVRDMELWMRAADVLVTKAGPNTLAEAFIAGLPLILYTALPGQEEGNITHVTQHRAGVWAPHPAQAADAAMQLLRDPAQRRAMAACSRALAHPDAAAHIARKLWNLAQRADDVRLDQAPTWRRLWSQWLRKS